MPHGCCSVREYSVESWGRPDVASSFVSLRWRVVGAGDRVRRPVRLWNVPAPHEDNRVSRPNRQVVRRASDDTELEHNHCDPANLEGSEQHVIIRRRPHLRGLSAIEMPPINGRRRFRISVAGCLHIGGFLLVSRSPRRHASPEPEHPASAGGRETIASSRWRW